MKNIIAFFLLVIFVSCETVTDKNTTEFSTPYENSESKETATYKEVIDFYLELAKEFSEINVQTIGQTDSGYPLHLVTFNPDGEFDFKKLEEEKITLLINNGIHPGESDGIDATMLLYRDLAEEKISTPKNTVITTIPIYNIGGALNRNSSTRANQNGPKDYGFRGNALNYDLNRDFIKSDTKNAKTFSQIFHLVQPDIFIDNHVSNGADYQYALTHLFTQHNKLGSSLGNYLHNQFMPLLENKLAKNNWDITPYVNVFNTVPEKGFSQFMDHPRYSTGYTTLWNTIGMMVETHMLKPYKQRVEGTYIVLKNAIEIAEKDRKEIKSSRIKTNEYFANLKSYPIHWQVDTLKTATLNFKGFEADTIISKVTGFPRLKYNRDKPFTKEIIYQNYFKATDSIPIPKAYIVQKEWTKIINLLELNDINYSTIEKDTTLFLEKYKIDDYSTSKSPYEGHYLHYNTSVSKTKKEIKISKGDIFIPTNQKGVRYILETLEPSCVDSFFNWNYFDTILQQKEDFSPYVFEDTAALMLEQDSVLRESFYSKKKIDTSFSKNWYAQLDWLYKKSKHYENAHLSYPVYRVPKTE
ncbi:M14 family metallopeptidase [uncultured Maribacter sp.]|uniref:M14 family metallopeptidase n=1 Tax=uncultured Maribacter sp. TaxID=431308 RepID=UPI002609F57A|nr:M14 family metallopeptidase [uncultured Maribacter sp.]